MIDKIMTVNLNKKFYLISHWIYHAESYNLINKLFMAVVCCLMAWSHYLSQCWLYDIQLRTLPGNAEDINQSNVLDNQ